MATCRQTLWWMEWGRDGHWQIWQRLLDVLVRSKTSGLAMAGTLRLEVLDKLSPHKPCWTSGPRTADYELWTRFFLTVFALLFHYPPG